MNTISPKEYKKTDDYKERAYSYVYRRDVDDLKENPINYNGHIYCSQRKLNKKLDADFGSIKKFLVKNLWQIEGLTGKVELGVYCRDFRNVESVWIKVGNNLKTAIWVKDSIFDFRDIKDEFMLLQYFKDKWQEQKK
jgi:hypothetical protein